MVATRGVMTLMIMCCWFYFLAIVSVPDIQSLHYWFYCLATLYTRVSRVIMNLLGAAPGPIDDMFLVKVVCCWDPDGLFKGLHVIHKLIGNNFDFVVNHNIECQLLVRPTNSYATKKLEEALQYTFKFDEERVKIYKLVRLDLLPLIEDIFQTFISSVSCLPLPGYEGYEDLFIDLETTQNPIMSKTTMSILGVVEGQHNQGLLAVKVQFVYSPHHITHAYHVVHVWPEKYKFAVDQNRRVLMAPKCRRSIVVLFNKERLSNPRGAEGIG